MILLCILGVAFATPNLMPKKINLLPVIYEQERGKGWIVGLEPTTFRFTI